MFMHFDCLMLSLHLDCKDSVENEFGSIQPSCDMVTAVCPDGIDILCLLTVYDVCCALWCTQGADSCVVECGEDACNGMQLIVGNIDNDEFGTAGLFLFILGMSPRDG